MAFLEGKDREAVKKVLNGLPHKVKLLYFTKDLECQYCQETNMLVEEMDELSNLLDVEVYNFMDDREIIEKYPVDKVPAMVLTDESRKDYGIRFYGIPAGYEFSSLLEGIRMIGNKNSGLTEELKNELQKIDYAVHLQVFVTPTCPYCPSAVINAHKFAYENGMISADMIEATEFQSLSTKYHVQGVPMSVVNEEYNVEGSVPESVLLDKIIEAKQQAQL